MRPNSPTVPARRSTAAPSRSTMRGAYAGEALVETVKASDKRLISYGVDLGTRITTKLDSRTDQCPRVHAHHGMLSTRDAVVETQLHHPQRGSAREDFDHRASGAPRVQPHRHREASETARNVYRFEVKVPAAGSIEFPVTEENVYDRQVSCRILTPDSLLTYIRNRNVKRRRAAAVAADRGSQNRYR